jgi:hypothetical protein
MNIFKYFYYLYIYIYSYIYIHIYNHLYRHIFIFAQMYKYIQIYIYISIYIYRKIAWFHPACQERSRRQASLGQHCQGTRVDRHGQTNSQGTSCTRTIQTYGHGADTNWTTCFCMCKFERLRSERFVFIRLQWLVDWNMEVVIVWVVWIL